MLLYIAILGFIVAGLLLWNLKQSNRINVYLFFFFFIGNIYALAHYASVFSKNKYLIAILVPNFSFLYMLIGPLLYFYVRGLLTDDSRLKKNDYLHFIPALIILVNISKHIFSSWQYKLQFADSVILDPTAVVNFDCLFLCGTISFLGRPIIIFIYLLFIIRAVYLHYANQNNIYEKQSKIIFKWLVTLVTVTFIIFLTFSIFTVASVYKNDYKVAAKMTYIYLAFAFAGLIVLNLSLLFFPNILYGLPQFSSGTTVSAEIPQINGSGELSKKNVKAFEISKDKLLLLQYQIEKYCEAQPYLKPNFSLSTLSAETKIPVHHLSYFFNEFLHVGFNTWKNNLKIEYVLKLIHSGSGEILTLDALAKNAGFGSRTTFFNVFKHKMGTTPSEYLHNLHQ